MRLDEIEEKVANEGFADRVAQAVNVASKAIGAVSGAASSVKSTVAKATHKVQGAKDALVSDPLMKIARNTQSVGEFARRMQKHSVNVEGPNWNKAKQKLEFIMDMSVFPKLSLDDIEQSLGGVGALREVIDARTKPVITDLVGLIQRLKNAGYNVSWSYDGNKLKVSYDAGENQDLLVGYYRSKGVDIDPNVKDVSERAKMQPQFLLNALLKGEVDPESITGDELIKLAPLVNMSKVTGKVDDIIAAATSRPEYARMMTPDVMKIAVGKIGASALKSLETHELGAIASGIGLKVGTADRNEIIKQIVQSIESKNISTDIGKASTASIAQIVRSLASGELKPEKIAQGWLDDVISSLSLPVPKTYKAQLELIKTWISAHNVNKVSPYDLVKAMKLGIITPKDYVGKVGVNKASDMVLKIFGKIEGEGDAQSLADQLEKAKNKRIYPKEEGEKQDLSKDREFINAVVGFVEDMMRDDSRKLPKNTYLLYAKDAIRQYDMRDNEKIVAYARRLAKKIVDKIPKT